MKKSLVLITLFGLLSLSQVLACNCSPMLEVIDIERRVDFSDIFFKGKIIEVDIDSIPYKSIKVTYEIQYHYNGMPTESKNISIYYDNMTSCGVSLNDFENGKIRFVTARRVKNSSRTSSYLEANYCDFSNEVSSYDQEVLNKYLKWFTEPNDHMPVKK